MNSLKSRMIFECPVVVQLEPTVWLSSRTINCLTPVHFSLRPRAVLVNSPSRRRPSRGPPPPWPCPPGSPASPAAARPPPLGQVADCSGSPPAPGTAAANQSRRPPWQKTAPSRRAGSSLSKGGRCRKERVTGRRRRRRRRCRCRPALCVLMRHHRCGPLCTAAAHEMWRWTIIGRPVCQGRRSRLKGGVA